MKNPYKKIFLKVQSDIKKAETNFGSIVYPAVSKEIPNIIRDTLYSSGVTTKDFKPVRTKRAVGAFPYALKTVKIKRKKGQKTSIVTLRDTGQFYRSIKTNKKKNAVLVKAQFRDIYDNFRKADFRNEADFENSVLSLHPAQKRKLATEKINPAIIRYLRGL